MNIYIVYTCFENSIRHYPLVSIEAWFRKEDTICMFVCYHVSVFQPIKFKVSTFLSKDRKELNLKVGRRYREGGGGERKREEREREREREIERERGRRSKENI